MAPTNTVFRLCMGLALLWTVYLVVVLPLHTSAFADAQARARLDTPAFRRMAKEESRSLERELRRFESLSAHSKHLLGDEFDRRRRLSKAAGRANDAFFDGMAHDVDTNSARHVVDYVYGKTCSSSYNRMSRLQSHLLRDWSAQGSTSQVVVPHVLGALRKQVPKRGARVLVPGAGLGRLAFEIAAAGYTTHANECAEAFVGVFDWVMSLVNKPRPLAPWYGRPRLSYLFDVDDLTFTVPVPDRIPNTTLPLTMVVDSFFNFYRKGGKRSGTFDAVVTSFFIDTSQYPLKLLDHIDNALRPGGVWINIGPLNWGSKASPKLTYSEVIAIFRTLDYDILVNERVMVPYAMKQGVLMHNEEYLCAFSVARKP